MALTKAIYPRKGASEEEHMNMIVNNASQQSTQAPVVKKGLTYMQVSSWIVEALLTAETIPGFQVKNPSPEKAREIFLVPRDYVKAAWKESTDRLSAGDPEGAVAVLGEADWQLRRQVNNALLFAVKYFERRMHAMGAPSFYEAVLVEIDRAIQNYIRVCKSESEPAKIANRTVAYKQVLKVLDEATGKNQVLVDEAARRVQAIRKRELEGKPVGAREKAKAAELESKLPKPATPPPAPRPVATMRTSKRSEPCSEIDHHVE